MTMRTPPRLSPLAVPLTLGLLALLTSAPAGAQAPGTRPATQPATQPATTQAPAAKPTTPSAPAQGPPPVQNAPAGPDYLIGVDDVITIVFWREKDLNGDVTVRPDGMISLPLINDIRASGLTTLQLRTAIMEAARRFVTDPSLTVSVKTINSRKVYVTGQVNKAGTYPLTDEMTVLQMLAVAGGLSEFAKSSDIIIMRTEQGQTKSFKFNYKDIQKGKNLQQNIALKPGDTIVVP